MLAAEPRRAHGGDVKWRFEANFPPRAYLIETVVCYPSSCDGGIRQLIASCRVDAGAYRLAAQRYRNSPDRNALLTTIRNRRYTAGFIERFNPIEISR
jgi:hypothetical protein